MTRLIPLSLHSPWLVRFANRHTSVCLSPTGRTGFCQFWDLGHRTEIKTPPLWAVFLFLGRVTRFELATFGTTNRRSNQLSYTRHDFLHHDDAVLLSVPLRQAINAVCFQSRLASWDTRFSALALRR